MEENRCAQYLKCTLNAQKCLPDANCTPDWIIMHPYRRESTLMWPYETRLIGISILLIPNERGGLLR